MAKLIQAAVIVLALVAQAAAQERAGVVTNLQGDVTVARASLPAPAPLKFKDDVFVRDRISTGSDSVARILLGGRAVVTVREHSVVSILEAPGVATVDVASGRIAVAVAREKMKPGDRVDVRTPNAVAGIRGTVIVAEVFDATRSSITVLKGVIDVTRLVGGREVGAATILTALHRVTIGASGPLPTPETIAPDAAKQLGQEFRVAPPRTTPAAAAAAVNQAEVDRAARLASSMSGRASSAGQSATATAQAAPDSADDDNAAPGDGDQDSKPAKAPDTRKSSRTGGSSIDVKASKGNDQAPRSVSGAANVSPVSTASATSAPGVTGVSPTPVSSVPGASSGPGPALPIVSAGQGGGNFGDSLKDALKGDKDKGPKNRGRGRD
jgi:FecR protein